MKRKKLAGTLHAKNLAALRTSLGLSQEKFWRKIGVTQSAGSRYERGAAIPLPVALLIGVCYLGQEIK